MKFSITAGIEYSGREDARGAGMRQALQFQEIIERRHLRMLDIRREGAEEMLAEFQAMEDEVSEVLDPKQRESWREIAESVRNRFIAVSPK